MEDREEVFYVAIYIAALTLFAFWIGRKTVLDQLVIVSRPETKDRIHG